MRICLRLEAPPSCPVAQAPWATVVLLGFRLGVGTPGWGGCVWILPDQSLTLAPAGVLATGALRGWAWWVGGRPKLHFPTSWELSSWPHFERTVENGCLNAG